MDELWREHLDALDDLREGIGLRGYAQQEPLVEYKKEAFSSFEMLLSRIDGEITRRVFRVQPMGFQPKPIVTNLEFSKPEGLEKLEGTEGLEGIEGRGLPAGEAGKREEGRGVGLK